MSGSGSLHMQAHQVAKKNVRTKLTTLTLEEEYKRLLREPTDKMIREIAYLNPGLRILFRDLRNGTPWQRDYRFTLHNGKRHLLLFRMRGFILLYLCVLHCNP